ncbi:MAG: hypothetical protein NT124_01600, partial [Candidatus Dependentiae bacterium]|nr:hypothetical protein [Candidatus Dependentiae bacterium]
QEYRKLHLEGLENASHLTDTSNATINDLNPGDRQNLNDKYASIKSQVDSLTQNATEEQKTLIQDFWSRLNRLHFPNRPAFKAWK